MYQIILMPFGVSKKKGGRTSMKTSGQSSSNGVVIDSDFGENLVISSNQGLLKDGKIILSIGQQDLMKLYPEKFAKLYGDLVFRDNGGIRFKNIEKKVTLSGDSISEHSIIMVDGINFSIHIDFDPILEEDKNVLLEVHNKFIDKDSQIHYSLLAEQDTPVLLNLNSKRTGIFTFSLYALKKSCSGVIINFIVYNPF